MFESDDFDQVLSQFDFPEVHSIPKSPDINKELVTSLIEPQQEHNPSDSSNTVTDSLNKENSSSIENDNNVKEEDKLISPKYMKRKIINSHFDHQSKRKFPGPAGILTGALVEAKDDSICQIELLSQDIDFTQNNLQKDIFDSPIWRRLLSDSKDWQLQDVDSIKTIKHQALAGNLRRRKAQTVTAFVEAVDRSVTDPLIILRDKTGSIKCTLHRDAWSKFSPYIVSEYCALILQRPTVLTTGGAFKKHYLNITLGNILVIYSSAVLTEDKEMPDGYSVIFEEDFTVIKTEKSVDSIGSSLEQTNGANDLFDGLDNIFSDEAF